MSINQIGLRIAGTKVRRAGFAPLVNIGVIPIEDNSVFYRPNSGSDRSGFVVRHFDDFICYIAIDNNVRNSDADATGVLCVILAVPANQQLAGGKSPYDLLIEAYQTFRSNYMTELADGRLAFQNVEADAELFRSIVARYALEPYKGKYIRMNPAGPVGQLQLPVSKMGEFMKDTQYPEFAKYKEIEVAPNLATSMGLENIVVPRPHRYDVVVNGRKRTSMGSDDQITIAESKEGDNIYPGFSFSFPELKAAGGELLKDGVEIKLNEANETIYCEVKPQPVMVKVTLRLPQEPGQRDLVGNWLKTGSLKILLDGKNIGTMFKNGSAQIKKSLSKGMYTASPAKIDGYNVDLVKTVDGQDIMLTVKIKKPAAMAYDNGGGAVRGGGNFGGNNRGGNGGFGGGTGNNAGYNQGYQEDYGSQRQPAHKPDRMPFIIGIVIGLLVGALVGYYLRPIFSSDYAKVIDPIEKKRIIDSVVDAQRVVDIPPVVNNPAVDETSKQIVAIEDAATGVTGIGVETLTEEKKEEKTAVKEENKIETKKDDSKSNDLESIKAQIVKEFNANHMNKATELIGNKKNKFPELEKYTPSIKYILKIRQGGVSKDDIGYLQEGGYYDKKGRAISSKFQIQSLDELKDLETKIKSLLLGL